VSDDAKPFGVRFFLKSGLRMGAATVTDTFGRHLITAVTPKCRFERGAIRLSGLGDTVQYELSRCQRDPRYERKLTTISGGAIIPTGFLGLWSPWEH
jgi:hypothetical protein